MLMSDGSYNRLTLGSAQPDAAIILRRNYQSTGFLQQHVIYFTPFQSYRSLGAESASLLAFDTLPCGFYTADSSNAMAR